MQVKTAQEALYIACEMEKNAIQLYRRALMLTEGRGRAGDPLHGYLRGALADEESHLLQFGALYEGLDADCERRLTLSAVASELLFKGGLMAVAREGGLDDVASLLRLACESERKAAAAYADFAAQCDEADARAALEGIARGDAQTSHLVGRRVEQIKLPAGARVGAIVRGEGDAGQVLVPHHDTVIEEGDHVIIFVPHKRLLPQVEKLFQVRATFF